MKRLLLLFFLVLLWALPVRAQNLVTLQTAAAATGNGQSLPVRQSSTPNGAVAQVTGTFSATITWEVTINGTDWVAVLGTNLTSGTQATTATAAGIYAFSIPRAESFRARISAYVSGAVTVEASAAPGGVSRLSTSGGGGSGITTLNAQTGATQSFTDDTNVTVVSAGNAHAITWAGTLAVSRGGSGAGSLTGLLLGNGTSAFTALTTSAGVAGAISDELGSGKLIFSAGTLDVASGKTFTVSNTLTLTGTDSSAVAFGGGGTVLYSGGALGTPSSGTLTNATGLPIGGLTGLGANVGTFLGTPTSANFLAAISNETGTGLAMGNDTPTIITPSFTTGFTIGGAATSRKIMVGNGTNFVPSTETYAVPGTSGNVLTSDGTNWTSAAPAASGANTALSNLASVAINTDLLPASTQGLGNASFPFLASFIGNTTQYESVSQTAGVVTHAALGSATNIGIGLNFKGTGTIGIGGSTVSFPGLWQSAGVLYVVTATNSASAAIDAKEFRSASGVTGGALFGIGTPPRISQIGSTVGLYLTNSSGSNTGNLELRRLGLWSLTFAEGTNDTALTRSAANTVSIDGATDGSLGLLLAGRVVTAKTTDFTVTTAGKSTYFTNSGAAGAVVFTLHTAAVDLPYTVCRDANFLVTVVAGASTTIRVGASVTAAAGNVTLDAVGSCIHLQAISTTQWYGMIVGSVSFN